VVRIVPMYWVRAVGGTLVFASFLVMVVNLAKTIMNAKPSDEEETALAVNRRDEADGDHDGRHRKLEGLPAIFTVLVVISILVGSVVELMPSLMADKFIEKNSDVTPYTALELAGRDIYLKEGCYTCHSQMIRPMVAEKLRYGKPSQAAEFVYDHPFQWGSRRIGPDLARVGEKYPHMWHYRHMLEPRDVTPGSIMPTYPWLFKKKIAYSALTKKLNVMKTLGVPYSDEEIKGAVESAKEQAEEIWSVLNENGVQEKMKNKEIIALIAYLQRLGVDLGGED